MSSSIRLGELGEGGNEIMMGLMRLGSKYRRLWNVSYLSTSCIIVKCRSFRVLTKAMFFLHLWHYSTLTF